MMSSLASFHRTLAPMVGLSEAALYERQKALVRIGILPKATGRGWASGGARANPESVAWMLISILATDNLSEVDERIVTLARAAINEWRKSKICRLTKATTFLDALIKIIQTPEIAKRVSSVGLERRGVSATIYWNQPISKKVGLSHFNHFQPDEERGSMNVTASLSGTALARIAAMLKAEET